MEWQTLPFRPTARLPQKKIFEDKLPFAGRKRSTARYFRVIGLGPRAWRPIQSTSRNDFFGFLGAVHSPSVLCEPAPLSILAT